eukprot:PhM_4_TR10834/c0_g1_i1/m.9508/K14347/SLC10A7, P7; solute carrier family 10 (sodium/bile acid cotransporter), member 7
MRRLPTFGFARLHSHHHTTISSSSTYRRAAAYRFTSTTPQSSSFSFYSYVDTFYGIARRNWFTLAIPAVAFASSVDPSWMATGGTLRSETWKDATIFGMFLFAGLGLTGLGAALHPSKPLSSQMRVHGFIQVFSLLFMPLVFAATAWRLKDLVGYPDYCALGMVFTGCLPTTIGVGVALTRAAGGDALLALLHAAIGNGLGAFITPLTCLWLTGLQPTVDRADVAQKLFALIFLPVGIGLGLRRAMPGLVSKCNSWYGPLQQMLLLLLLSTVFSSSFAARASKSGADAEEMGSDVIRVAVVMTGYFIAFFALAWGLTRSPILHMSHEQRIAASYCATQKTAAMGVPMLQVMFRGDPQLDLLTLPLLCYHPIQTVLGGMIAPYLKKQK